jgi:hypothetical protein
MMRHLPKFENETEEAEWWYNNREKHAQEFLTAFAEGRLKRGGIARRLAEAEKAKNLVLGTDDAMKAAILAEEKGVEVQTYLSELVHNALQKEIERAA